MKVLIVDDDAYNRELLGCILRDYDYDYVEAENGAVACDYLKHHRDIDIVLMDVSMPVMDGFEATRQIKAMSTDIQIPVLFVTALDDEQTLSQCLEVGGDDFVVKPVNEKVLAAKLKAHQRTIAIHRDLKDSNRELQYHRQVMDREHSIVEHVFQKGIKRVDTSCDNVSVHVSPLSMFNGDLLLVAPSPSGGVYTLLGDFTGHGLSAAIGCMPVSDIFYAMTAKQASVGEIAAEINERLQRLLPDNMFFCATLLELSQAGNRLSVWSGGMNDLLLIDTDNQLEMRVQAQHMPLAILSVDEFEDDVQVLQPSEGARLFAYTDGVIEEASDSGELFGEPRLLETLLSAPDNRIGAVVAALDAFRGGANQGDDTSMLELRCSTVAHGEAQGGELALSLDADDASSAKSTAEPLTEFTELPLQLSVNLGPEHIRVTDVIPKLLNTLANVESVKAHRDILYTLLAELYNNAVDHGLLGLDSRLKETPEGFADFYQQRGDRLQKLTEGELIIQLKLQPAVMGRPASVRARFTDSGPGFDYRSLMEQLEDTELSFGRGIVLVQSLCEKLSYSNGGRTVDLIYVLD